MRAWPFATTNRALNQLWIFNHRLDQLSLGEAAVTQVKRLIQIFFLAHQLSCTAHSQHVQQLAGGFARQVGVSRYSTTSGSTPLDFSRLRGIRGSWSSEGCDKFLQRLS
ncbi:Uncharacterised protein [Enterobacter asburiae]|uniref:Uncharacterized protein n=1 Tax=Enterobacter asburiae TaxID=61645 RepID=A0A376FLC9_ENTAS|nr:Uncharacterised protein [Enterobacter asburiae]